MRHLHRSQITALGAAMLLLASCGSPEQDPDPAPAEDVQEANEPTATPETDDPEESDGPDESEQAEQQEQPEDSETSGAPEDEEQDEDQDQGQPEPTDDAAADFHTDPQESEGFPGGSTRGEEPNHLVEIRSGVHEGYDRVVFEFSGDGTPSWRGEYTDTAAELGRGEPIEIAGEHILEINVNGPAWDLEDEADDKLPTQEYYERDTGRAFEEIFIQGPFEAHSQYLIGLEQELPFQVQLLEEPTRLVVDLATDE